MSKLGFSICPFTSLNLLNRPMLLPYNHTFCSNCIPVVNQFGFEYECPVCKAPFVDRDLMPLPFMENLATIYKCLDSPYNGNLHQSICSDVGMVPWQSPHSTTVKSNSQSGHSIDKDENCRVPIDAKGRIDLSNAVNPNSPLPKSFTSSGGDEECTIIDINPVDQAAPLSPPSFGDAKGSNNDGYPFSKHNSECSLVDKRSTQEKDMRRLKRQKKMNHESVKFGVSSAECLKPVLSFCGTSMTNSELEPHTTLQHISAPEHLDDQSTNRTICVFCQSSKILEGEKNPRTDNQLAILFLELVMKAKEMMIDSWHIVMRMKAPREGSWESIAPLELPLSLHFHHFSETDELNVLLSNLLQNKGMPQIETLGILHDLESLVSEQLQVTAISSLNFL